MGKKDQEYGPATRVALAHRAQLKPEHQSLLGTLLADRGMAGTTLESLVEHLLEEEGPQLQEALCLAKAGPALGPRTIGEGATVGSLREPPVAPLGPQRGTVGSLRK